MKRASPGKRPARRAAMTTPLIMVAIRAPVDVKKGDLIMTAPPGAARAEGWAMALSPEDLERFAFGTHANPVYAWLAIAASYIRGSGELLEGHKLPSLEDHKLPVAIHLYLHATAHRVVELVQDGNLRPAAKAAALAKALGFTRRGWNAFAAFERDAAAHFAEHRRVQMQRDGARYVEARDELSAGKSLRSAERLFARGKRRGARPQPSKPPP